MKVEANQLDPELAKPLRIQYHSEVRRRLNIRHQWCQHLQRAVQAWSRQCLLSRDTCEHGDGRPRYSYARRESLHDTSMSEQVLQDSRQEADTLRQGRKRVVDLSSNISNDNQ
jgi:hypothetical protein